MFKLALCSLILCNFSSYFTPLARAEFPLEKTYVSGVDQDFWYLPESIKNTGKIVLTFDDGPDETLTPRLLDLLKQYHFQATFFLVGDQITEKTKPIIVRALKEGHLIGSHSLHHLDSNSLSEAEFKADLSESIALVRRVINDSGVKQNEVYYRFPFGNYGNAKGYHHFNVMREVSQSMFGQNCINFAFWNIDPADGWGLLSPKQLMKNVLSNFDGGRRTSVDDSKDPPRVIHLKTLEAEYTNGGVLLMHDVHDKSLEAMPAIFKELERRHIPVVPLNSLPEFQFNDRECGARFHS